MSRRIGILGGTFSPIHKGHIALGLASKEEYSLDEVWFMVTGVPYHKEDACKEDPFVRFSMVKAALLPYDGLIPKDYECYSLEKTYTADSLKKLSLEYSDTDFYFIMGEDSLDNFHNWKDPEVILSHSKVLVGMRPGQDSDSISSFRDKCLRISGDFSKEILTVDVPQVDISSSRLREAIVSGEDAVLQEFLTPETIAFIKEHRLYQTEAFYDPLPIRDDIQSYLTNKRFLHSIRVAQCAADLAGQYCFPVHTAYIVGLLHDCAKHMSQDELIAYCKENDLPITEGEYNAPYLLHGKVGALMAKRKYNLDDEMCHAIEVHTRGCENMNLLDKMVFTADYIESERHKDPELSFIRHMAFRDLDLCVFIILRNTLRALEAGNRPIDNETRKTFEYYRSFTGAY